jgi:ribonuclease P protein component
MRSLAAPDIAESRVGYIIRKRAGHAPMRNAFRRILRETFSQNFARFEKPFWVVFEVSDKAAESTRRVFRACADSLLENLCKGTT